MTASKTIRLFNPTPAPRPPVTDAVVDELAAMLRAWFRAVGLEAKVEIRRVPEKEGGRK